MEQGKRQTLELYILDGFWRLRFCEETPSANPLVERYLGKPAWIGPATGPERLTRKQAEQIAQEIYLPGLDQNERTAQSATTIADFVEKKFVPEHVATKKASGRTHYQAMLKHVLKPEEVDRIFQVDAERSRAKLKAVPNWPYLGNIRLHDAGRHHVQDLITAAVEHRYSTQTVTHIRNVVSAIFEHARKEKWFTGDNPARHVTLPGMTRKESHTLTLAQTKQVLRVMRYPEKEMTLIAILTGLNVAEICGLQWKHVNLTDTSSNRDGEQIPPRTIAVRKEWYLFELSDVDMKRRRRNEPIPQPLLPILRRLSRRPKFTGPNDFVLVSRAGTPINEAHIATRRLRHIGRRLQMPWLSWHVFRRTHTALAHEFGKQFHDYITMEESSDRGATRGFARRPSGPVTLEQWRERGRA